MKVTKKKATKKAAKKKTKKATWRQLRPADVENGVVDAVVDFGQRLYQEDPGTRPITAKDIKSTLRTFAREPVRGRAVVAVEAVAGRPVVRGYALLCSFWSNELGGEVCTVDEFYVDEAARGRGLGTALVRGLKDGSWPWFKRAVALELEVTPGNRRARLLYERLGFSVRKNSCLRLLR